MQLKQISSCYFFDELKEDENIWAMIIYLFIYLSISSM